MRASTVVLIFVAGALVPGCVDKAAEHRVRANAFLKGGDAAAALKECDEGLARRKGDPALSILRGNALFELERFDEARDAYQAALDEAHGAEARSLSDAYRGLGMVATRKGDYAAVRSSFEQLIAINPKDASSHLNVAKACLALRDIPCAIDHGEAAGHLRGDQEKTLYALGEIYLAAGKPKEADLTFAHICDVVPGAATCPYGAALVAAKAGERAKALASLEEAVRRKLPNPDQIAADPGFETLRDDPEFRALAARASGK